MPFPAEPLGSLMSPGTLDDAAGQTPYGVSMPAMPRGMDNLQGVLLPMSCQLITTQCHLRTASQPSGDTLCQGQLDLFWLIKQAKPPLSSCRREFQCALGPRRAPTVWGGISG